MPTFDHVTTNDITVNLNVTRRGWNDGVLVSAQTPMPITWEALAGDDAETAKENWDGAAVLNGTLQISNVTSGETVYSKVLNGVYATFIGFPINVYDEVSYGDVAEFSIAGVSVTYNFGEALEPITKSLNESIYYRQIEDTESWGSEHEKNLFIPRQNPVPQ